MGKSIHELVDERFGVRTRVNENPETLTVGTAETLLLRADPNRLALVILNLSGNTLFVKPRGGVTTARGIALSALVGSLSVSMEDDFTLPSLDWFGISTVAGQAVFVLEILSAP